MMMMMQHRHRQIIAIDDRKGTLDNIRGRTLHSIHAGSRTSEQIDEQRQLQTRRKERDLIVRVWMPNRRKLSYLVREITLGHVGSTRELFIPAYIT